MRLLPKQAQTLFGVCVPEIIAVLSAFTQHISLEFSVKRLFITSVLKVQFSKSGEI